MVTQELLALSETDDTMLSRNQLRNFRSRDVVLPCSRDHDQGLSQAAEFHGNGDDLHCSDDDVRKFEDMLNFIRNGNKLPDWASGTKLSRLLLSRGVLHGSVLHQPENSVTWIQNRPGVLSEEINTRTGLIVELKRDDPNQLGHISSYTVRVVNGRESFSVSHQVLSPPAVAWHPLHPHILTVLIYPINDTGACITSYDVITGHAVRSRRVAQVDSDMDSVTRIRYTPDGRHLVVVVLENVNVNDYLTRLFVLDAESFNEASRTGASLLKTCHTECVWNVYPQVSVCGGYVCVPTVPHSPPTVHTLPQQTSLMALCRKSVLQSMSKNDDHATMIVSLDIPETLKRFLKFQ